MTVNKENMRRYIEALETERLPQVCKKWSSWFKNVRVEGCALTVLQDLYEDEVLMLNFETANFERRKNGVSEAAFEWIGVDLLHYRFQPHYSEKFEEQDSEPFSIIDANDDFGATFAQIAEMLREEFDIPKLLPAIYDPNFGQLPIPATEPEIIDLFTGERAAIA